MSSDICLSTFEFACCEKRAEFSEITHFKWVTCRQSAVHCSSRGVSTMELSKLQISSECLSFKLKLRRVDDALACFGNHLYHGDAGDLDCRRGQRQIFVNTDMGCDSQPTTARSLSSKIFNPHLKNKLSWSRAVFTGWDSLSHPAFDFRSWRLNREHHHSLFPKRCWQYFCY